MSFSRKINICSKIWIYLICKSFSFFVRHVIFTENKYVSVEQSEYTFLQKFLFMSFSRKINICRKIWIHIGICQFFFPRNYLVTFYIILTGIGWNPPMDEIKTIDPLPWFCIWGTTDLASKNEAFTLTSNILSHASSLHWKKLILNNNFPWKWHKLLAIQSVH